MIIRNSMSNIDFLKLLKEINFTEVFDYDPRSFEDIDDYKKRIDGKNRRRNVTHKKNWVGGISRLTMMLGLYKDNIIAISDDFFLLKFCDYFQDIPWSIPT